MPTPTYQDVLRANGVTDSWAFTEASGTDFVPWAGSRHLTGHGSISSYRGASPISGGYSIHLDAGAYLTLPLPFSPQPPAAFDCWVAFDSLAPAATLPVVMGGTLASSGNGMELQPNGHVAYNINGVSTADSGFPIPDAGWHHWALTPLDTAASQVAILIDGQVVWAGSYAGSHPNAPNIIGWGADGAGSSASRGAMALSYPAWYMTPLTPTQLYANFLAASDPARALSLTAQGGGNDQDLLQRILDAVIRTFPPS